MSAATAIDLNLTFAALADPTRRAILIRLSKGDASVLELAEPFELSQPAISKHLKVLERAGLISRGRDAQRRPCRIEGERLKEASDWLGTYRKFWEESYSRLDDLLDELQTKDARKTRAKRSTRTSKETAHDIQKTRDHRRRR
jgi:DNA-binding transcriptional ArsR family regulator